MRIGFLLPNILASQLYGTGRIFAPLPLALDLADGLVDKGHSVFFYSACDVKTKAAVICGNEKLIDKTITYEKVRNMEEQVKKWKTDEIVKVDFENELTMLAYKDAVNGKVDIIQSFLDFSAHYFDEVTKFPTVYTLHDPLPQTTNTIEYERLKLFQKHKYISISQSQRKSILDFNFIANIYHGINLSRYPFSETSTEKLVFIGRLLPEKGVSTAIALAIACDKQLELASSDTYTDDAYYKETIEPFLTDPHITMHGFFDEKEKGAFLGSGKAFLFPLQWEEPFGLVMIEAMSVGTPVIAYARGSVTEIVVDGETGFLINPSDDDIRGDFLIKKTGIEGMKEAVHRLYSLSKEEYTNMRVASRKRVQDVFTVNKMVDNYEKLYTEILQKSS